MWWLQLRNSNTTSPTPGMHVDVFIAMTSPTLLLLTICKGSVVPHERRLRQGKERDTM